jgi:Tripartite tricarboxylate transporter family receptor
MKKLLLLLAAIALSIGVSAQPYPNKPIKFIVPFTAGSATDIVARTVAEAMGKSMGQSIVIENKVGAGGTIATAQVAKADADGYTVLVHSSGHVLNPALYPNLGYDTLKDLTGITTLAAIPNVLVVNPSKGWKTQADLIAAARAKPGTFNYASAARTLQRHATRHDQRDWRRKRLVLCATRVCPAPHPRRQIASTVGQHQGACIHATQCAHQHRGRRTQLRLYIVGRHDCGKRYASGDSKTIA